MSMHNRFSPHTISEFFAWMSKFFDRARARHAEYLDHGQSDIDFNTRAIFEAMMYFESRINEVQSQLDEVKQLLGVGSEAETK